MAWPCITRACCINRFWSELDKADIAVPLVFTKYSDVAEVQHVHPQRQPRDRSVAIETQAPVGEQESAPKSAALGDEGSSSSVMRQDFKAWKVVRPERSCKPRNQYHPSEAPFNNESQYQKDYKPWPIPKKGDHPWIPKASPTKSASDSAVPSAKEKAVVEVDTGVEKCEIEEKQQEKEKPKEKEKKVVKKETEAEKSSKQEPEEKAPEGKAPEGKGRAAADALNRQIKQDGSSYRTEFKAYTDVKPVRPIRAKSQYKMATTEKASLETSYSATFRGEQGVPQDNKQLDRRRIRSLYNEPRKDSAKVEKSGTQQSKPKKSTTSTSHSKQVRKAKDKQKDKDKDKEKEKEKGKDGIQTTKKKSSVTSLQSDPVTAPTTTTTTPTAATVSKQSKEMINRLANEGKE
ncbi:microtubule-associated protein 6 homolog [Alosa alosa]|uniref:microtubule-associated protein 6 homolog n=1 Tax=Alosa alosa TaxID=278164 RepID=UPI00201507D9|nr:microtubule-associated protein 6 homolog [Alosa alosa]